MYCKLNLYGIICVVILVKCLGNDYCTSKEEECSTPFKYIFYDVNPPEGFNLRRDVYMRFAVFLHKLSISTNSNLNQFKLVLPPWSNLYHWGKEKQQHIPWSHFFDIESLQKFAPVIEMHQFFNEIGSLYSKIKIDDVYILQHFEDMFETGNFEDKMEVAECNNDYTVNFFDYNNITFNNIKCLSFHGHISDLQHILKTFNARTVMFDHGEIALHDSFGDKVYWQARRSMRFNKELKRLADDFRKKYLNSTDNLDNAILPDDWTQERYRRSAKGGPYLSVHLRRRDFAWGRPNDVPTIENAAVQIQQFLDKLNLKVVFVATDAPKSEFEQLKKLIEPKFGVFKYSSNEVVEKKYKKGGLAIIDQIICSYARYFVGTHESTFSFRIQEEREILGFPVDNTFNRLCGSDENNCVRPSIWKIEY